jgi:hypothetical protein
VLDQDAKIIYENVAMTKLLEKKFNHPERVIDFAKM